MSALDPLAADWPRLQFLLDQALDLPTPERGVWLQSLPPEDASLRATLARLLELRTGLETGDFLGTLPRMGNALAAPAGPDPRPGELVGPWRLERELGRGGMGSVWLAGHADGRLKRRVALKLPRLSWARGLLERMARERDILATLEHPHIARLYDAGVDDHGRPWLALEYVQGQPIDAHAAQRRLDLRSRVALLLQVCDAAAYAHSRLVIHRDLKPANILVTDDGRVMLLDFGIAKLVQGQEARATALTELAGRALTLDYASPEQVRGEPLTTASDVYSLGVVAYELLAGGRPYQLRRGSAAELEDAIEHAELRPPSAAAGEPALQRALRGPLDAIVLKALRKDTAQRYPSIEALAADLSRWLAGEPVLARPDALPERLWRQVRRHPVPLALGGALALALLGGAHAQAAVIVALGAGVLLALWQRRQALAQAERVRAEAAEARRQRERAEVVKGFALSLFEGADIDRGGTVQTTALELLQRAEADLAGAPPGDPETALEIRLSLGQALLGLDQAEATLRVLDEAEAFVGGRLPASHPVRLDLALLRADALQHLGRHAEAEPLLDSALPLLESLPGRASRALRLRAIGAYVLGRYPPAMADVRDAVQRAESAGDPLELLLSLNEQTRMLGHQFQADRLGSAERALAVALRCDPQRHALPILTARELHAAAHCFEGDARRGLEDYGRIVADLEQRLGARHSRLAAAWNGRAQAQYQCGDSEGALASLHRCMEIERANSGPDTQHMRQGRAGQGGVLVNEGRFEEGLALLRQAYDGFAAHEGPGHPLTRFALDRLIAGLVKAGQLDEAESRLELLHRLSEGEPRAMDDWRQARAQLLRARGDHAEALALLEPMQQRRAAAPLLHMRAVASAALGGVFVDAGRHDEAIEPLEQAIALFGGRHPFGSAAIARARVDLGRARLARGELGLAVSATRDALAYWDAHGPDRQPAAEAAGWLALALHAAGEPDEARRLAERARPGPWRLEVDRLARLHRALAETGLMP